MQVYLRDFRTHLVIERGLSRNTVSAYFNDLRHLEAWCRKHACEVTQLTTQELSTLVQGLSQAGYNPRSQARAVSAIRAFFRFLVREGRVENNPARLLESPQTPRELPDVLSVRDIEGILGSFDLSTPEGYRDRALIEMLYGCGLRVSELCALRTDQLHLNEGYIRIIGKGSKERLVPIGNMAAKALDQYLKHARPEPAKSLRPPADRTIFLNVRGTPLSRVTVFHVVKRAAESAGVHKTISPHTFRHSFATHLVQNGADLRAVQEMLGHSSITTTEIYTHLNLSDLQKAVIQHHPLSSKL